MITQKTHTKKNHINIYIHKHAQKLMTHKNRKISKRNEKAATHVREPSEYSDI